MDIYLLLLASEKITDIGFAPGVIHLRRKIGGEGSRILVNVDSCGCLIGRGVFFSPSGRPHVQKTFFLTFFCFFFWPFTTFLKYVLQLIHSPIIEKQKTLMKVSTDKLSLLSCLFYYISKYSVLYRRKSSSVSVLISQLIFSRKNIKIFLRNRGGGPSEANNERPLYYRRGVRGRRNET